MGPRTWLCHKAAGKLGLWLLLLEQQQSQRQEALPVGWFSSSSESSFPDFASLNNSTQIIKRLLSLSFHSVSKTQSLRVNGPTGASCRKKERVKGLKSDCQRESGTLSSFEALSVFTESLFWFLCVFL